jgi:S-adenosyl-L-methionine hydrolase (adenosine-forming)
MRVIRIVTLLTDFGTQDPFVGILKGVILGLCPEAVVVDLCHEVRPFDIRGASFLLQSAAGYFPKGTIHLAVVDPGVGGDRRPVLAEIDGRLFVAPDNGILGYAMASGQRCVVRELSATEFWRRPVSASFQGRDIFAPVAGHLAAGVSQERFGPIIHDPVRLEIPSPTTDASGAVRGQVVWIDRFGNCITNISRADVGALASWGAGPIRVLLGARRSGLLVSCFAEAGAGGCGAIVGSTDYLELFCNQGDFAGRYRVKSGDPVGLVIDEARAARPPRASRRGGRGDA